MSNDIMTNTNGEIVLYQPDKDTRLEVQIHDENVWLSIDQMSKLFGRDKSVIGKHIRTIFKEGELVKHSVWAKFAYTASDGKVYQVDFYNLDVIISVGYRVHSIQGTQFRIWATNVLRDHLLKGYTVNRQLIALQQHVDERFMRIEDRLQQNEEQIAFFIRTNEQPSEMIIPTGCVWDAYTYISGLIRKAEKRIILIDNFVDERTLLILDKRSKNVEATVYTRYHEQTELDFNKHNSQCSPIDKIQLPHAVHDRYLIIDDTVWLLGSSIKDMGRGLCTIIQLHFTPEEILSKLK